MQNAPNKSMGSFLIGTVVAVTLFVSPWNSVDPVNLPKLSILSFLALAGLGYFIAQKSLPAVKNARILYVPVFLFLISLLSSFLASNQDLALKFYGTPGRNTGFLAYLSLTIILFLAASISSDVLNRRFIHGMLFTGTFLAVYGILQSRGIDFFDYLNGYSSNTFGTFGNPNFQSAYMGIIAAVSTTFAVLVRESVGKRIALTLLTILALLNIYFSSWQGYFVFASGILTSLLIFVFTKGFKKVAVFLTAIGVFLGALVVLGIFNLGPLASVLYKASLGAREIYWRTALNIIGENAWFGVGPDGYGDWFRRSRGKEVSEGANNFVADSAHSIPLDIGSTGGIPLLFSYLLIVSVTMVSIFAVVKRSKEFDPYFASLAAAWVGYQAQSLISINQLGLGIWGWAISGLVIGYAFVFKNANSKNDNKLRKVQQKNSNPTSFKLISIVILATLLGGLASLPPYLAGNRYFSALRSGDADILLKSATLAPSNRRQYFESARIFADNKLFDRSLVLLRAGTQRYPDYFELWQLWSAIPDATSAEVAKAKSEMRRLDPYNPAWR